jgi:predicted patatin/cPLA2 family phospholipase
VSGGEALVIEGGGMKSAYANGVLSAFEEAGHAPWGTVYGTSAGGALAAWYGAGQARVAERTWAYAQDRRVLDYRRLARGRPILDHELLWEVVYRQETVLDQWALRKAAWPVIVTAAEVETGACRYVDLRTADDPIAWLKATGRLPWGAGKPVEIAGKHYLDGGIVDPIPVGKAIADGHHHVTVLLNWPAGVVRKDSKLLGRMVARRYPMLRHGVLHHAALKQEAAELAEHPPAGVRVDVIRPSRPTGLHRLSRGLAAIDAAIEQGRADGVAHLERLREA